ncbi:MAG: hypothetical protein IKD87_08645 [Oscillospiraceae bacterium]|nr:hypothetical protein [Oscillospiraceae bacterium]
MDRVFPKVLVISHNVFSRTMNVGRFLADTFKDWPGDKLSQLFFYDEIPTTTLCKNYYRITDYDVLASILHPGQVCGHILTEADIDVSLDNSVSDDVKESKLYRLKEKHERLARFLREAAWATGIWKTKQLDNWIRNTRPDIIYYVMSDYCFPFMVTEYIAKKYDIPVFVSIEDDYYFNFPVSGMCDRIRIIRYRKDAERMIDHAFGVSYASEIMKDLYEERFHKNGIIQLKSAVILPRKQERGDTVQFLYAGSMSFGRWKSLIEIGKVLEQYDAKLIIYSNTDDEDILAEIAKCQKIEYRGFAPAEKIEEEILASDILLVVESFDEDSINRVKCSLSTKIADYIGAGRCILACGPKEVGSIDYLLRNDAAVVTDYDGLSDAVELMIKKPEETERFLENALGLAKRNHSSSMITELLFNELKKGMKRKEQFS